MKKLLRYIFIPVLAILLMSHNVFAVDMSPNVHPIWANANPLCSFYIPATDVWQNNAFSNNTTNQTYSVSKINCDYPQGLNTVKTYAVYSFRVDNFAYDNSADSGWLATKVSSVSGSADWGVIGQTVSSLGATGWQIDVYLYSTKASNGGTFQIFNPLYANEIMYLKPNERIYFVGASYWQVTTDTDFEYNYTDVLNGISSKLDTTNSSLQQLRVYVYNIQENQHVMRQKLEDIKGKIDNIGEDTANNVNNGQADATQGASDNSSTSANNNSTDQTTSNLLGVFGSFVTALTSISPSNCNVDFDLGHIDFGVQNLCSQPVPQAFTVVTSIIVVCFTIPFVVHLIRRILSLIREMQT